MHQFTILLQNSSVRILAHHITTNAAVNKLRCRDPEGLILCEFNLSDIQEIHFQALSS